jgi:ATP phosphoribosyltransferase
MASLSIELINLPIRILLMKKDVDVAPVIETDMARGGVTGHNVRYVLGASLAFAVVIMVIVAVSA